jgi:SNF2 family DNA or RNA helicase
MGSRYFSSPRKQLPSAVCGACGEGTPLAMNYCVWCGVHLEEAESYREHREERSIVSLDAPGKLEWRPVLKRRRIRTPAAAAEALLAYEGLLGDDQQDVVLGSLADLPFLPLDYQMRAAQTVLGQMHGRAILADEVGLGKTIEAGLVVKELLLRKLCENVLILVPSSLVEQWKRELQEKFDLDCATHETARFWRRPLLLLSLTRAKQGDIARRLGRRKFGLVLVDEAHSLKNSRTVAHGFVRGLRTERLLLLTATPIENDLRELFSLLSLVDPAVYPSFRKFAGDFLVSRYRVKDVQKLRHFCARYMIRNRRKTAFPEMPPRHPRLVRCEASEAESEFLRRTLALVRSVYSRSLQQSEKGTDRRGATAMLFLTLLLKESCSSPDAVMATVSNVVLPRLHDDEAHRLEEVIALGRSLPPTGKMEAFVREVEQMQPESAVAYVEFFATHERLTALCAKRGIPVIGYTGRMSASEKQEQVERFRQHGGLMLCTEVGGQGLNLQHCRTVINYDVPWNPMRLEQRIGRVHRYGQEQSTNVLHLVTVGTYEEHVLELLTRKLELFTQAIGELEAILSFVEEEESLQQMVAQAICAASNEVDLQSNFQTLNDHVEQAAQRYRKSRDTTSRMLDGEEAN